MSPQIEDKLLLYFCIPIIVIVEDLKGLGSRGFSLLTLRRLFLAKNFGVIVLHFLLSAYFEFTEEGNYDGIYQQT